MGIQLAVHQQHVIAPVPGSFDERILRVHISGIEAYCLLVLVGLVIGNRLPVILEAEVLAVGVLHQGEVHGAVTELLVREHAIFDEELDVVPLLLECRPLAVENLLEPVRHLLGDVGGNLLDVAVALEIAPGHVQRDVRRVDDSVKQGEELRYDVLHVVCHEHLVAVELDLVLLDGHPFLDLREIEYARQVERIVHIQVDVEQRFVVHRVEGLVELHVVLLLQA